MENKEFRLNSASNQRAVNEDTFDKIQIESKSAPLPIGEVNKIINLGEQFNKERQESKLYRLTGSFDTLFNNVLFNTTGTNSWETFNTNTFRDGTYPPVPEFSLDDEEDLTYIEAIAKYLTENNGWFGYYDPDPSKVTSCTWVDMEPRRELFSMTPKSGVKNWEVTVTYPTYFGIGQPGDFSHPIVSGGLLLIDVEQTTIGNRSMLTFATPVKHGLSQGDSIEISGVFISNDTTSYNGQYNVIRLGKNNGDDKDYYFSVDIEELVTINANSRVSRLVNGRKSVYYLRVFKKIKTISTDIIENDDYEIYPLAFSQTIYEDKVCQYVFNEDIDVSNLKDNLGRPLSELYITIIKTTSNNVFTPVKSGIKMPLFPNAAGDAGISDINRITNSASTSHIPLEIDISIDDELFYGDVVEYNLFECIEKTLGVAHHRFNTINRENGGTVDGNNLGIRLEGYVYKPHHKVQIRQYSNYVEQGQFNTLDRPSYSDFNAIGDGRYLWRDLLDIGLNDTQQTMLDYPFLNGCHYINSLITLPLFRQDPFGYYGYRTNFPNDRIGTLIEDKIIIKRSQDVC